MKVTSTELSVKPLKVHGRHWLIALEHKAQYVQTVQYRQDRLCTIISV